MSNSSQIRVRRIAESTHGTTPASAMDIVPYATFKMSAPISRETPGNVAADRIPRDNGATDRQVSGQATSDNVYGQYDRELECAFCATMGSAVTVTGTDIAAVASGNKLTKGSGGWSTFAEGDIVKVTGFSTNPAAFIALVVSNSSGDLTLAWPTLVDEAATPSITVTYAGRLRVGTSLLTNTYEMFNVASSVGEVYRYVGINQFSLNVPFPNKCVYNFGFMGGDASISRIASALANSSNAASTNPLRNSNVHFGGGSVPTQGLGFRYAGDLLDLRIKSLTLTLGNPLLADGGAGTLGPQDLTVDQLFTGSLDLTFLRNTADAESLIADADDVDTVAAIGFGFRDGAGLRDYWYLPQCQPSNEETDGLKQAGRETVTLKFMLRYDAAVGFLQYAKLG